MAWEQPAKHCFLALFACFVLFLFLLSYRGWVGKYVLKLCPTREMSILIFLGKVSELFLFLGAAALVEWLLLGREFPLLPGDLLFPDSSGSLTGSSLGKDFFFLLRLPLPAVSSRSLLTSSSSEKDLFLGGLEKETDGSSIPFS